MMQQNLLPQTYWDSLWTPGLVPDPIDPADPALRNHVYRDFDTLFVEMFDNISSNAGRLLEIGCGRSRWLPYFAKRFGCKVAGLDYSPDGCERAREILAKAGVSADVVCGDLFASPPAMPAQFDVVVSFGVVEHFADTPAALSAMSRFATPGGLMLTVIPNMVGMTGVATRVLNRPLFEQHVPLDVAQFEEAHRRAGLEPIAVRWLVANNFRVVNLNGLRPHTPSWHVKRAILGVLTVITAGIWLAERHVGLKMRRGRRWSPYLVCIARRPLGGEAFAIEASEAATAD